MPLQENPPIDPIPQTAVAKHLLEEKPHKIRMVYVAGTGVITQHPDANSMVEAFKRLDFVVVQDPFMTSTAKYADIVLPVTTTFESKNVLAGIRSRYIQLMEQAIEPPLRVPQRPVDPRRARHPPRIRRGLQQASRRPHPQRPRTHRRHPRGAREGTRPGIAHSVDSIRKQGIQHHIRQDRVLLNLPPEHGIRTAPRLQGTRRGTLGR